jgi:hypothetical protein
MTKRLSSEAKRSSSSKATSKPVAEDEVQESLEKIYRTDTGDLPNFEQMDRVRRSFWLRLSVGLGVLIVFLGVLAWTGLFALQPLRGSHSMGLSLVLHQATTTTLGQEETLLVEWSNEAIQPLATGDIRLSLPPEFHVLSLDPAPTDAKLLRWDLGLVPPHATGRIRVTGQFLGGLGDAGKVQAVANFRNQNTDRNRQVVVSQETRYEASVLAGSLQLPETVLPGDPVVMQYSLQNTSQQVLKDLVARISIPDGFLPTASTTVDAGTRSLEFRIGTLPAQSLTTIQLPGRFAPGSGGEAMFAVEAGQKQGDQFFPIQRGEKRLSVLAGELALRVVANGTSATTISLRPGEPLRILAEYQNTSPETLKNILLNWSIEAIVDGKVVAPATLLDLSHASVNPMAATSTKAKVFTIEYQKEQIAALASLAPGASGRIEVLLPTLLPTKSLKQAQIRIAAQSQIGAIGSTAVNRKLALTPLVIQFTSDAQLSVQPRYYTEEGAPLGSGPLPPIVGKTTTYRVFWIIQKKLHALDHIDITSHLPRVVAWGAKQQTDAGTLIYDETKKEIHWRIDTVPDDVQSLEASFEVQVTPAGVDAGRFAQLLEQTSLRAHDTMTNEWLTQTQPVQTTDLQEDEAAKSKGVVRLAQ